MLLFRIEYILDILNTTTHTFSAILPTVASVLIFKAPCNLMSNTAMR